MARIIFTLLPGGGVLPLTPYLKHHARDTVRTLDAALSLLTRIESGSCSVQEMAI